MENPNWNGNFPSKSAVIPDIHARDRAREESNDVCKCEQPCPDGSYSGFRRCRCCGQIILKRGA